MDVTAKIVVDIKDVEDAKNAASLTLAIGLTLWAYKEGLINKEDKSIPDAIVKISDCVINKNFLTQPPDRAVAQAKRMFLRYLDRR